MSMIKKEMLRPDFDPIPQDDKLPGLLILFDSRRVQRVLEDNLKDSSIEIEECRGTYVRYKPGTNCVAAYSAKCVQRDSEKAHELIFYGKCFTLEDFVLALEKVENHEWEESPYLKSVIVLPDVFSIFYVFPNDCELEGLPTICHARKISRLMYKIDGLLPSGSWRISDKRLQLSIVRYKPEKRAVVKLETKIINKLNFRKEHLCIYLRTYSGDQGKSVFDRMHQLSQVLFSETEVIVPRALAFVSAKSLLLTAELKGESLVQKLASSENLDSLKKTAKGLAILHRVKGIEMTARTAVDLLEDVQATANTLKYIVPEQIEIVSKIVAELGQLNSYETKIPTGFVHGDFHCGQVLIQDDAAALLDFDRSYVGDTLADVGNFCAHLQILSQKHCWNGARDMTDCFISNYETETGRKLDQERLRLWTGFGLFLFSVYPFRSLELNWNSSVIDTLKECHRVLS